MKRLLMILFATVCHGAVLRVPSEFATIQAALDATNANDTVLVSLGVYAEALTGPSRPFVLMGEVGQDSGDVSLPIIDPSTLPNSCSARCLAVVSNQSGTVIENISFRNGPQMFPRLQQGMTGGVENFTVGLVVRNCVFDSVYIGVKSGVKTILENCRFMDGVYACIDLDQAELIARNCIIRGRGGGWALIEAGSETLLENCTVSDNGLGNTIYFVNAHNVTLRGCVFEQIRRRTTSYLYIRGQSCVIENCVFRDNEATNSILGLECPCDSPAVIRGCTFESNYTPEDWNFFQGKCVAYIYSEGGSPDCPGVLLEHNTFRDGQIENGILAVQMQGPSLFTNNRVTEMIGRTRSVIEVHESSGIFRDNLFYGNQRVLDGYGIGWADAILNWWGDLTGPFHPVNNPLGRGDEVGGNVTFVPWHTDTLFLSDAVELRIETPTEYVLNIYPNPFNNTTNISFDVLRDMTGRLVVYDALGRVVQTLFDGELSAGTHLRQFDGGGLSSGVYFVKLESSELNVVQKAVLLK